VSRSKVAIGLPVYNGAKYVAEAIESVQAQTYSDFELLISDNASSDATEEICRDFASRDSRIHYSRAEENRGAAWNFNRAFELSRGEYFKWLAHDDVIGPQYLARAVAVLDENPTIVLCHARTGIIDGQGELVTDPGSEDLESWEIQGVSRDAELRRLDYARSPRPDLRYLGVLLYSIRNHEVFGLMRREAMHKTGLHHPYCGGEKVFLAELSLCGLFHEVPEVLAFSRWHDERFSANASASAQHAHMDPKAASRFRLPRQFRASCGYLQAIARGELGLFQRARCLWGFSQFLMQLKKWKKVLSDYTGGVGQLAKLPDAPAFHASQPAGNRHWTTLSEVYSEGILRR
jgi:glycosyltransferase involved in cell wall biosynthesis